jgi:hypothetical protein
MAITKQQLVAIDEKFIEVLTNLDNEKELDEVLKSKFIGVFADMSSYEMVGGESINIIEHEVALHTCDEDGYNLLFLIDTEVKKNMDFEVFIEARIDIFVEGKDKEKQVDPLQLELESSGGVRLYNNDELPSRSVFVDSAAKDIEDVLGKLEIPDGPPAL